jgi:hypothetical protein
MVTAEGNTHQLLTAASDVHVEGDTAADVTAAGDGGDVYPRGDHGKYADEKAGAGEKDARAANPIAELEGDVAFPDCRDQTAEDAVEGVGREGVGKGFVLTD